MDVGACPEPSCDGSFGIPNRNGPGKEPAILTVIATDAGLNFEVASAPQRGGPCLHAAGLIIGMEHQFGPAAGILFRCDATEAEPLIVDEGNRAVGSRDPDDGWDHVGKGTETSLAVLKEVAVLPELGDRAVTRERMAHPGMRRHTSTR